MVDVKIHRFALANVGTLVGRFDLGNLSARMNVVTGRNEAGKSTIINALKAGLFEKHNAGARTIKKLQPRGTKLAPKVWIELSIDGVPLSIYKKFLVSPTSEVREGSTFKTGADADALILERLGARQPGKHGSIVGDMGLWGLLWVAQGGAAHEDPGKNLDPEVRGTLVGVVQKEVGRVLGGPLGEKIRVRAKERTSRYWTPNRGEETKELAAARSELAQHEASAQQIEAGLKKIEDLADRMEMVRGERAEIDRIRPQLDRELEEAKAAEARLHTKTAELATARAELAAATAALERAVDDLRQRESADREISLLEDAHRTQRVSVDELEGTLRDRKAEAEAAGIELANRAAQAHAARLELDRTSQKLEAALNRQASADILSRSRRAAELSEQRAAIDAQIAEEGISDEQYQRVRSLEAERTRRWNRLESRATRLVLRDGTGREIARWTFPTEGSVTSPGGDLIAVAPARIGLAAAVERAKEASARYDQALSAVEQPDLMTAQQSRRERLVAELEMESLEKQLLQIAPRGVDELSVRAERSSAMLETARRNHLVAESASERKVGIERALIDQKVGPAEIVQLRDLAKTVDLAKVTREALGTQLKIRAIGPISLSCSGSSEALAAGEERVEQVWRETKLVIDDVAEIEVAPQAGSLVEADLRVTRASTALEEALRAVNVSSLAAAESAALERARLDVERQQATRDLAAAAPKGLDALRGEIAEQERRLQEVASHLQRACQAKAQIERSSAVLTVNRVTGDALVLLGALDEQCRAAELEVKQLAASIRVEAWNLNRTVASTTRDTAAADVTWELIPGEAEAEDAVQAEIATRTFAAALEDLGVIDVSEAERRWTKRLVLAAHKEEISRRIEEAAPEGFEQLSLSALAATRVITETDDVAVDEVRPLMEQARASCRALEKDCEIAQCAAADAASKQVAMNAAVADARTAHDQIAARLDQERKRLAALRDAKADVALRGEQISAGEQQGRAKLALDACLRCLEELSLSTNELERSKKAVQECASRSEQLRTEEAKLDAWLNQAAAEGRFEQRDALREKVEVAQETLKRIERAALAARMLFEAIEYEHSRAHEEILAPVHDEVGRYLKILRPGTDIRMSTELAIEKILSNGVEEDFESLSGGTREQLSVIVRLALAKVLARRHGSLPLILDDAMCWTDDHRFLQMARILSDAAGTMQILFLSCHPSRVSRVAADHRVDLDEQRLRRAG